jgi:hypothetical protein
VYKTQDYGNYELLRNRHIRNIEENRLNAAVSTQQGFFEENNREHLRKIARANEESRSNFQKVIAGVADANIIEE